jgi:uncharacterized protein YcbK (DUF882 family)
MYPYFTKEELACPCCGKADMDETFMEKLVEVRKELNKPMVINSGYRCEKHNKEVGGSPNSAHLKGRAVDISIKNLAEADQVRLLGVAFFFHIRGWGINDKKSHFIHLDDTRPRLWTY